jgi:hypothetical protein
MTLTRQGCNGFRVAHRTETDTACCSLAQGRCAVRDLSDAMRGHYLERDSERNFNGQTCRRHLA